MEIILMDVTPLDKLLLDDTIWRFQSIPSLRIPVLRAPYPTFGMVMPLPFWWTATERFYPVNVDHLDFQLTSVKNYILEAAVSRCKHIITSRVGLSAYTFRWAHEEPRLAKLAWNYLRGDSTDTATAGRTGTSGTTLEFAEQPSALWSTPTAERFRKRHAPYSMDASRSTALETVLIAVRTPGSDWPSIDMDESYALLVDRHGILLVANQTWGAIRGLESLSQLMWRTSDGSQVYINQTLIHDRPRFAHRGLLIDTSRHYISKSIMLLNLEAMAYNKLNVLHWHIVDDSSYPYQSSAFPELSKKGAFSDRQIYTASDIKEIVEFARMRGIRVLPEFDIPGHTRSLAYSKPELLAQCRPEDDPTIYFGPLNPFANETFAFLKALLEEIVDLFPDEYVHLGGDEVEPECWEMDTEIEKAQRRLGAAGFQYHEYFWRRVQNTMTDIGVQKPGKQRKIIIWQEVLQHVSEVLDSLVMQIWKPDSAMDIPHTKHLIYSSCWYLDNLFRIRNWGSYYLCDPETKLGPQSAGRRIILGGEASMWSEYQSDDTILQKIWPVTSGIAERLWSPYFVDSLERVGPRIEEQRCRMIGRGIPQSVLLGPGSCDPPGVLSSTLNAPDVGDGQSQFALLGEGIFNDGHLSLSLISCVFYLVIGAITGSLITLALSCFSASFRPRLNGAWPRRFSLTRLFCAAVIITTTLFFLTMYIV
ncbi:unnamed protein product [Dicrocoelium dendriticum]|nr:unnamed protein product [Dicrocoelium dendriticum]